MALLLILWFVFCGINMIGAPIVGTLRWRLDGFKAGIIAAIGSGLTGFLLFAILGALENYWKGRTPVLVGFLAIGSVGAVMVILGWRRILRPVYGPDQCPRCGYALSTPQICPECGTDAGNPTARDGD